MTNIANSPRNFQTDVASISDEQPIVCRGTWIRPDVPPAWCQIGSVLADAYPILSVHWGGIDEELDRRLERYGRLHRDAVRALGVDQHQQPPLHVVDGGG